VEQVLQDYRVCIPVRARTGHLPGGDHHEGAANAGRHPGLRRRILGTNWRLIARSPLSIFIRHSPRTVCRLCAEPFGTHCPEVLDKLPDDGTLSTQGPLICSWTNSCFWLPFWVTLVLVSIIYEMRVHNVLVRIRSVAGEGTCSNAPTARSSLRPVLQHLSPLMNHQSKRLWIVQF